MRVLDLFCGAGGFSEGFRQAGFTIICGVDNWQAAVDSFSENHPNSAVSLGDIEVISKMPNEEFERIIPDSEIIIGSPPCIAFSNSNKSGKGDKTKGLSLIKAFLTIVARKKLKKRSILKYWILENVAKAEPFIKCSYTAKQLQFDGDFKLNVKNEASGFYRAEHFGVPSKRKRYFCGEFPAPGQQIYAKGSYKPLKEILCALGTPCENLESTIVDPNYALTLTSKDITDHHYIQEIAEFQWKKLQRLKEDKGYMGKMYFPENEERLCRAIMATMTFSARESMAFAYRKGRFRSPTIREVASLMSFPIDYRFYGKTKPIKHKLVGNAVPPKLAFAFASAIAETEGISIPKVYEAIKQRGVSEFQNLNFKTFTIQQEKPKRITARFKYHVPYLKIDTYRVELTNYHSDFQRNRFKWDVEIHKGQGPMAEIYKPKIDSLELPKKHIASVDNFLKDIKNNLVSFRKFQKIYCLTSCSRSGQLGPEELLARVKELILRIRGKHNPSKSVSLKKKPYKLPEPIAIGYFVLTRVVDIMRRGKNG